MYIGWVPSTTVILISRHRVDDARPPEQEAPTSPLGAIAHMGSRDTQPDRKWKRVKEWGEKEGGMFADDDDDEEESAAK